MNPELLLLVVLVLELPLLLGCCDLRCGPPPGCGALAAGAGVGPAGAARSGPLDMRSARRPPSLYLMKSVAKFVTYHSVNFKKS